MSVDFGIPFSELIYQIKEYAPTEAFASKYIENANHFLNKVKAYRTKEQKSNSVKNHIV